MDTLETLAVKYPNKTGAELLGLLQDQKDKIEAKRKKQYGSFKNKANKLNSKPTYYKGSFGTNQYYFYKIIKADYRIGEEEIYCTIDKIVIFDSQGLLNNNNKSGFEELNLSYNKNDNFVKYSDIIFGASEITEEEYTNVLNSIKSITPTNFKDDFIDRVVEFGSEEHIKNLESEFEDKHEKLRKILIDSGASEYGDCIIDEICELFNYADTIWNNKE